MPPAILVVDDDAAIRNVLCLALEDEGYAVGVAANGKEAWARILDQPPALVLLDLNMPGMSGWELHARMREGQLSLPVIFMTAGRRAQVEAEKHGADGYLVKPFELDELSRVIRRVLAGAE